jgi:hypothetical protein
MNDSATGRAVVAARDGLNAKKPTRLERAEEIEKILRSGSVGLPRL